ncbi:MAG: SDR family NAD(P)-dependent oxidoreductase [Clostridia bacterium]|nr:SDR family NAD(P)-dependent oxidoreductase [Clostridia bacterium]
MKNVLITGAFGGMGMATAKMLSAQGVRIFALDKKVSQADSGIIPIEADVTSEESIKNAFSTVSRYTDSLCAIIHYAGVYMLDSLVEMENEDFRRIFDINMHGVYLVNKTFMPLIKKGSKILITTSELAPLDPLPFTGIYAITKGALDKYAYSLRMELQLLGVTVSVLRAGAVDTGMLDVSTSALERFCEKTRLYSCNATRFKKIVDGVEARRVMPEKIAKKSIKIIRKKAPRFAYSINRNPLLLLLNALPKRLQLFAIRKILK